MKESRQQITNRTAALIATDANRHRALHAIAQRRAALLVQRQEIENELDAIKAMEAGHRAALHGADPNSDPRRSR